VRRDSFSELRMSAVTHALAKQFVARPAHKKEVRVELDGKVVGRTSFNSSNRAEGLARSFSIGLGKIDGFNFHSGH
jgi:hypothetical protein